MSCQAKAIDPVIDVWDSPIKHHPNRMGARKTQTQQAGVRRGHGGAD